MKQRSKVGCGVRPLYRASALELQRTGLVLLRDLLCRLEQLRMITYTQRDLPGEGARQKSFGDVKCQLDFSSLMTRNAVAPCLCPGMNKAGLQLCDYL